MIHRDLWNSQKWQILNIPNFNFHSSIFVVISVNSDLDFFVNFLRFVTRNGAVAQLFILSYSDAVSFCDIRGHLGTITSIVTFYICACRRRRLIAGSPVGIPGNKNRTNLSSGIGRDRKRRVMSLPMLTHPRVPSFWFFSYKLFSSWIWLKYCLLDLKQSINQFAHIIVSSANDVSSLLFNINIPW